MIAISTKAATLTTRRQPNTTLEPTPAITTMKNAPPLSDSELAAQIGGRRSMRHYAASKVSGEVVKRLLTAATRAPSAHNKQPWRFVVLENIDSRQALAQAMGRKLRQDRAADGDARELIEADVNRSYQRITQAPVAIVLCIDMSDMHHYSDGARIDAEYLMAVQSTAMAAQNLLLAAQAEGLGACIMCAPLFCPDAVTESLQLPPQWRAQMLVTIGEPGRPAKDRPRLPLDQITQWNTGK